jgi:hypothetical protein
MESHYWSKNTQNRNGLDENLTPKNLFKLTTIDENQLNVNKSSTKTNKDIDE